ncbi:MAG: DUF930 domain-containing protein [Pseudorhodoplanes sp.]
MQFGRSAGAILSLAVMLISPARASSLQANLKRLDPETRLEQVCDLEAMKRIRSDGRYAPDRAKSYVTSAPRRSGHTLTARGAAFRSGGRWFAFSFTCTGSPDHLRVTAFSYQVGKQIPESAWNAYGLWR